MLTMLSICFADKVVYPEVSETFFTPSMSPVAVGHKTLDQHSRSDTVGCSYPTPLTHHVTCTVGHKTLGQHSRCDTVGCSYPFPDCSTSSISISLWIFSSPEPSGSQGELIVYPCSGVRCRRCRCRCQQCLNIFSSETAWPIKAKLYVWIGKTVIKSFNGGKLAEKDYIDWIILLMKKIWHQGVVWPCPGTIYLYMTTIFKHLLHWNRLANQSQILCEASLGRGNESLYKWSRSHDQDGRHAHIW